MMMIQLRAGQQWEVVAAPDLRSIAEACISMPLVIPPQRERTLGSHADATAWTGVNLRRRTHSAADFTEDRKSYRTTNSFSRAVDSLASRETAFFSSVRPQETTSDDRLT